MKLKLDENGHVVVSDGKPVYVHDDGKEIPFDAPAAFQKISQLNAEAKSHRERAEQAEVKVKSFEGIDDVNAARKALEVVSNLDAKKLVDAGEVEKIKQELSIALKAQYEPQIASLTKERDKAVQALESELIGGAFARSPLLVGDSAIVSIPTDFMQAKFGQHFKIEDGKVVGLQNGQHIYSRTKPGEIADFNEALGLLIEQHPHRDQFLKSSGAQGGQASGGAHGSTAGKSLSRQAFDSKPPAEQVAFIKGGGVVSD